MRVSVPEDGVSSPVADTYPRIVSRLKLVSEDMIHRVAHDIDVDAVFNEYCGVNIRDHSDYDFLGKTLFPGEMCDNVLIEAGLSNLTPNEGVVFVSVAFHSALEPSIQRYNAAVESGRPFIYDTTPYNLLIEYTDMFHFIPTIAFPVSVRGHWGYVIVVPHGPSFSATVMWGDILRWTPPRGLMETFRAYLVLIFRGVKFSISRQNHTLDVLGFSPQQDGYSCGFYLIAAFNKLSSAVYDEEFPVDVYRNYDSWLTERYRVSCIRTLARHLLLLSAEGRALTTLEIFKSMRRQYCLTVEQVNLGVSEMFPEVLPENRICLGREHTCVPREPVRHVDGDGSEGRSSSSSGLVSEDMCPSEGSEPFIQTICLTERLGTVTFPDLVDISTVYRVASCTPPPISTIPPIPSTSQITVPTPPANQGTSEVKTSSPPAASKSNEVCKEESNVNEPRTTEPVKVIGVIEQTDPAEQTDPVEQIIPPPPQVVESAADIIDVSDPWTVEYDSPNIFAEISQRLVEGHLIRRPEYHALKSTEFKIRLRLRCRFHDPPAKCKSHAPGAMYQRCQVRMYARKYRGSGWRISFRFQRNHPIHPGSRLHGEHLRKRLLVLMKSLSSQYAGTAGEYKNWLRGARSVSEPIHALSGISDAAEVAGDGTSDPDTGGGDNGEDERKSDEGGDDTPESPATSASYTPIAPRPEGAGSVVKGVEGATSRVEPSSTAPGAKSLKPVVADHDVEEFISLKHDVQETLAKYVQGCVATIEGKGMKDELKHLSECFGFPMQVRDSEYIHDLLDPEAGRGPPQVKRIFFKCPVGEDSRLRRRCHHTFTVLSGNKEYMKSGSDGVVDKENECVARPFVVQFNPVWHNHQPDNDALKKCLPPGIWKVAVHMKDKSYISTSDIVRHIEDTYNISLDRVRFARRLRHEIQKRHPAEKDCHRLISNLIEMGDKTPGMFSRVRVVDDNALHSVCWGFPGWREEYIRFGIIPGASIDAKAIANNYDTPLAIICGRTNNKAVTIYFMGFLASQREEDFLWFLEMFREFVRVPPRLMACDQDAAIINTTERVFPTTLLILDDWHLNKNQLKNCNAFCLKRGGRMNSDDMSKSLYKLRESRTEDEFLERRAAFENEYFCHEGIPQWFRNLYYTYSKMVVLCYNRMSCGERFMYQGSGYVETSNSQYHHWIMTRKVPMARIPEEVFRYSEARRRNRKKDMRTTRFMSTITLVSMSQFGYTGERWERIVSLYTPYAWDIFISQSVKLTHKYIVIRVVEDRHDQFGELLVFTVIPGNERNNESRCYHVACPKQWGSPNQPTYISGMCTCHWSRSAGLPCRHAAKVAIAFRDHTGSNGRFPLETMIHPYWRQDRSGWGEQDVLSVRLAEHANLVDDIEDVTEDVLDEKKREKRMERVRTVTWSNGHAAWNQMHQTISKLGVDAMRKMDSYMSLLLEDVRGNPDRERLDIAMVSRRVSSAVEAEFGVPSLPRELDLRNPDETNATRIKNSSQGRIKGRGTRRRAKSWTEKTKSKTTCRKKDGTAKGGGVSSQPISKRRNSKPDKGRHASTQ